MNLIQDLRERGLIQDITPGTEEQLERELTSGYIGFDPTADSLHVGSLLPITLLMRLQQAGHKPIAIVGGATGMIGDPSGKSAERNLLDEETLQRNVAGIEAQLRRFLDFDSDAPNAAELYNNYDWFKGYDFLNFTRDVGKHITVSYMMSKDSVQKRLETGLSFTEFSYQLIQGYDFYWLNRHKGVKLQMGGADQWGNILTGSELIRRMGHRSSAIGHVDAEHTDPFAVPGGPEHSEHQPECVAFTCPLITKSDGSKFGKSEGGNIWLDAERTSPYAFYQFWIKLTDDDAARMAMTFSFKSVEEIKAAIEAHQTAPHQRALQRTLAEEMTTLVHSEDDLRFAQEASEILFSNKAVEALKKLSEKQLLEVMEGVPQVSGVRAALTGEEGLDLLAFLADRGVFPSKGEARKMMQGGGFSINKEKITDPAFRLREEHLLNGRYVLIQKGKGSYTLASFL